MSDDNLSPSRGTLNVLKAAAVLWLVGAVIIAWLVLP